jgi:type II secretory pathway pseudopilin PulG
MKENNPINKNAPKVQFRSPKPRKGFTVIEVILFIAISSFLIIGLVMGVSSTIARQRYVDSVQDFADVLRTQYYAVSNPTIPSWVGADMLDYVYPNAAGVYLSPEDRRAACGFRDMIGDTNPRPVSAGQSRCELYGRLITFGEDINDFGQVKIYLVVGKNSNGIDDRTLYGSLSEANLFVPNASLADPYTMQYGASAEVTAANRDGLRAAILIVRPPNTGTIRTLIYYHNNDPLFAGGIAGRINSFPTHVPGGGINASASGRFFEDASQDMFNQASTKRFTVDPASNLDICVGSSDVSAVGGVRRNVRVKAGGSTPSAVEIISEGDGNQCL